MRYMLLVYSDEHALSDTEREHCYVESAQLARDLNASGNYVSAGPLHPTATATSVRVRSGKRLVTDGPFAETREQLGGYYLIEAPNLDAAMSIAERIPVAKYGTIEIRPMLEITGLPLLNGPTVSGLREKVNESSSKYRKNERRGADSSNHRGLC